MVLPQATELSPATLSVSDGELVVSVELLDRDSDERAMGEGVLKEWEPPVKESAMPEGKLQGRVKVVMPESVMVAAFGAVTMPLKTTLPLATVKVEPVTLKSPSTTTVA